MYKSRCHFSNGLLSLAVDSLTGEILEFINTANGDNLIKNSLYMLPQPFLLTCEKDGDKKLLSPADAYAIANDNSLKAKVVTEAYSDGGSKATVSYGKLTDGEDIYGIKVAYTVLLPAGEAKSIWRIDVENNEQGVVINDVRFPCLNGIYFGDTWEDETLVYPYHAGIKIENPVESFEQKPSVIYWKWQEYRYEYIIGNLACNKSNDGSFALECRYSGNLSMTWLDYYDGQYGLYFARHAAEPNVCSLRAGTFGKASPGMNFSFIEHPYIAAGSTWSSPDFIAAIHPGDWHNGARIYRNFRLSGGMGKAVRPDWFEKSAGLVAHYDFKYQNGGIVHKYKDIPQLVDEMKDMGLNHLLFAGWHQDGFDNGFPEYRPDKDLGSEEELIEGIRCIKDNNAHVSFYINSRLANIKYDHLKKLIQENAVVLEDGSDDIEMYGNKNIKFAVMCVNAKGWQNKLLQTVDYVAGKIGIDGLYLDQLAMAPPCICHNHGHGHGFSDWNKGYQKILGEVIDQRKQRGYDSQPLSIIHEGVSDLYGEYSSGQLISTFVYHHCGAFPELYKYTFPDQILVDMLYPKVNQSMRPVHVGQASTQMINRAFVIGSYFWIYDLSEDNTFNRDPEQYLYLKNAIKLRKFWLEHYKHMEFMDTDNLKDIDDGFFIKIYKAPEGILIACANETGRVGRVTVKNVQFSKAICYTADTLPTGKVVPAGLWENTENGICIEVSESPLSLIYISIDAMQE